MLIYAREGQNYNQLTSNLNSSQPCPHGALNGVIKNWLAANHGFVKRRVLVIKLSPTVPHKERAIKSAPEYSRLFIKSSFFQKGISMPTIE